MRCTTDGTRRHRSSAVAAAVSTLVSLTLLLTGNAAAGPPGVAALPARAAVDTGGSTATAGAPVDPTKVTDTFVAGGN